ANGIDGADGAVGPQGPQGPQGPAGADGADGTNGIDGADGADGAVGPQGPQGPQGPAGADGTNGTNGIDGADGADGAVGPQGPQGPAGADGADGTDVSGTTGSIFFAGADGTITENNGQLFWDNSNNRIGIGNTTPSEALDVNGTGRFRSISAADNTDDVLAVDANGVLQRSKINYGARWTNTNTSTNLNVNGTLAPIFGAQNYNDDAAILYQATSNTQLTVGATGRYDIRANISLIGNSTPSNTRQRTNVNARIAVNGVAVGAIGASGYIRWASGHDHSSVHVSEILDLVAGDQITIITYREANSGTVSFSGSGESSFMINKLK
ncbi:MAG: hypothetical protein ACR2MM_04310, partial [Flavobacteriaceae bacterium]